METCVLSSLFINRLPQELCLIVSKEVGEAEWYIDKIMTTVKREISTRERAFMPSNGKTCAVVLLTATD